MQISIAITNYNRTQFVLESFQQVINDDRISEIVISDDASEVNVYEFLQNHFAENEKIRLFRNEKNVDCFVNKKIAVELTTNEWCILLDSDNIIDKSYIDRIYKTYNYWDNKMAYMPSFAKPAFSYKAFDNIVISKENVNQYIDAHLFTTMLNCANYFFNRNTYLDCWDGSIDPNTADSIWTNYNWLKAGNSIKVVEGLEYEHRLHDGSHYRINNHKNKSIYTEIVEKIKQLK